MLPRGLFLALCGLLGCVSALPPAVRTDEAPACPTASEYACFDVINSSLCLSQNARNGTAEQMAACVDYPGGMSDIPGAAKVRLGAYRATNSAKNSQR